MSSAFKTNFQTLRSTPPNVTYYLHGFEMRKDYIIIPPRILWNSPAGTTTDYTFQSSMQYDDSDIFAYNNSTKISEIQRTLPSFHWKYVLSEIHPGHVATIRSMNSTLKRAIFMLTVLPIQDNDQLQHNFDTCHRLTILISSWYINITYY